MTRHDAERIARMRAVWQEALASDFEVTTAEQRYLARKKARPLKVRSLWFEFGLGLGVAALVLVSVRFVSSLSPQTPPEEALLSGASSVGTVQRSNLGQAAQSLPPSTVAVASSPPGLESAPEHGAFRASLQRGGEESAVLPGVPYVVAAGESVQVRLGAEVQTVSGPSVLEFHLDPARASGWRLMIATGNDAALELGSVHSKPSGSAQRETSHTAPRSAPSHGASEPPFNPEPKGEPGAAATVQERQAVQEAQSAASWSEVAEALRVGEQQRAEAALQGLSQGADVATRDSARLALAQLWLSQGRSDEARGVLRSLREAGSTAFIRRRAAELLGSY